MSSSTWRAAEKCQLMKQNLDRKCEKNLRQSRRLREELKLNLKSGGPSFTLFKPIATEQKSDYYKQNKNIKQYQQHQQHQQQNKCCCVVLLPCHPSPNVSLHSIPKSASSFSFSPFCLSTATSHGATGSASSPAGVAAVLLEGE
ncbi:hypothetical protein GPALN_014444 [Globodera pallida]|nr:hypothetical protein GPALN_014444 [Globodera pallida]